MVPKRPTIVAHRGLHHDHPENSHAAFVAAWRAGIEWCECDVRLDRFDHPWVLHDDTLDRTTNAAGRIAEVDCQRLRDVRLRDVEGRVTDERLPALDAVAGYMSPGMGLLVEMKVPLTWLNDWGVFYPMSQRRVRWVLQSFDRSFIESVPQRVRFGKEYRVPTALLVDAAAFSVDVLDAKTGAIHVEHAALDVANVALIRDAGKRVGAWTVNAEADLRRVVSLGVDLLITDEPALAARVVDDLCGPTVGPA